MWWNAGWRIGYGQLVLAMAVLVAAQLAAGRARRDAMADLYASFPATAGTRTLAHLAGLAGAAPASLLLIAAAAVVVQVRGAIGAPSITVLAGGLLLVIAAGAAGIAIGTRFPHPLAGVLGALVLFLSRRDDPPGLGRGHLAAPVGVDAGSAGLRCPARWPDIRPPARTRWNWPASPSLAGIAALAVTVRRARARGGLAAAGILALAVICLAGACNCGPSPPPS